MSKFTSASGFRDYARPQSLTRSSYLFLPPFVLPTFFEVMSASPPLSPFLSIPRLPTASCPREPLVRACQSVRIRVRTLAAFFLKVQNTSNRKRTQICSTSRWRSKIIYLRCQEIISDSNVIFRLKVAMGIALRRHEGMGEGRE